MFAVNISRIWVIITLLILFSINDSLLLSQIYGVVVDWIGIYHDDILLC